MAPMGWSATTELALVRGAVYTQLKTTYQQACLHRETLTPRIEGKYLQTLGTLTQLVRLLEERNRHMGETEHPEPAPTPPEPVPVPDEPDDEPEPADEPDKDT